VIFFGGSEQTELVIASCATGITLLMCSLACAIVVGTSLLVTPEPYRDPSVNIFTAGIVLIFLSLAGGALVSYGFLLISRSSQKTIDTQ
jgi:hypothetical protein